jgi:Family of unknown function (DUF6064)
MLPFNVQQFFAVFRAYNSDLWPAIPVAYALGATVLWAIVSQRPVAARLAAVALALMWLWTGVAYHITYFAEINRLALPFGALFIAEAILLAAVGAWLRPVTFAVGGYRAIAGWSFIAYVAVAYPLIGLWSGHPLAELPQFGVTPCPLTLFTFGVLLLAKPPLPWVLLVIPVLWSLVGGSAAFLLHVPQDWVLLASGIATALLLAATRHSTSPA